MTETAIVGNLIGIAADGTTALGNGGDGVQIGSLDGNTGNTIGGTLPGEGNVIANNDGAGISILNCDINGNRSNPVAATRSTRTAASASTSAPTGRHPTTAPATRTPARTTFRTSRSLTSRARARSRARSTRSRTRRTRLTCTRTRRATKAAGATTYVASFPVSPTAAERSHSRMRRSARSRPVS